MPTELRLLHDPALPGPINMARDEALMTRVGTGESPPTLRLYQWNPPTISLGYFQRFADFESLPSPAGDLPVVRRLTGGGAILHDLELTYSIAIPTSHPLNATGPNHLYEFAHRAVIECLRELGAHPEWSGVTDDSGAARGPFSCFARRHRYDVLIGADKLAGSAQRRTRRAVLQHGSIVLGNRFSQQPTALLDMAFDQALPRVCAGFPPYFARLSGVVLTPDEWSADELALAESLTSKYAGAEWTQRS